jgi:hypothetical protein
LKETRIERRGGINKTKERGKEMRVKEGERKKQKEQAETNNEWEDDISNSRYRWTTYERFAL